MKWFSLQPLNTILTKQFQLKELLSFLLVQKINLSCSRIRKLLVVHLPRLSLMYSLLMLSMISICPILNVGKYIMIKPNAWCVYNLKLRQSQSQLKVRSAVITRVGSVRNPSRSGQVKHSKVGANSTKRKYAGSGPQTSKRSTNWQAEIECRNKPCNTSGCKFKHSTGQSTQRQQPTDSAVLAQIKTLTATVTALVTVVDNMNK